MGAHIGSSANPAVMDTRYLIDLPWFDHSHKAFNEFSGFNLFA